MNPELKKLILFIELFVVAVIVAFILSTCKSTIDDVTDANSSASVNQIQYAYNQCLEKYQSGRYRRASECFKDLLQQDDSTTIKYMYAISAGSAKNYKEACEYLKDILSDRTVDPSLRDKAQSAYLNYIQFIDEEINR